MSSIKKNFIYNTFYQLLAIVIPLITTPYLSRVLGAAAIGEYSYTYSVAGYFAIFIMQGINNYGNREIAKCRTDNARMKETFWSIYAMQAGMGTLVGIIYIAIFGFIKFDILQLVFTMYILSSALDIGWFYAGTENFKFITYRNIAIKIASTIMIFLLVRSASDIMVYCCIIAGSMLVSSLIMWPGVFAKLGFYKPKFSMVRRHIVPNLTLFLTVIAVSLFKIMDKIMLGFMSDSYQVGYYELAERIIAIPLALITSLGTVMLPRMSYMVERKQNTDSYLYSSMLFTSFIVSSMSFGIMGVCKQFVPLYYGEGYETCIILYLILLPSCIFLGIANVVRTQCLLPNHMDRVYVISAFLGAGVNLLINFLCIPMWGSVGAAIGTLFAEAIVAIYQCAKCRKIINLRRYLSKSAILIVDGIVMFVVLYTVSIPKVSLFDELLLKIVMGVIVYVSLLIIEEIVSYKIKKKYLFEVSVLKLNI
jgi:O-antigen/teichoic acid export membrane protein